MNNMSPLLQSRINSKTAHTDRYYESLAKNANNTLLPNESKAKLLKQNFFQAGVSNAIDTGKDCVNFAKAMKTGEISDNNLGRLNGLGMKLGAGLIAAFLAIHSKTKTEAAMKVIGGGAFLASMNLWPKLFIQMPTKLMHGVDINQKYVNAQGDKKEFFLDNQFIPWDITDVKSEKEQRRQSKVALQSRTLTLATAGFATPLSASLIGNAVEPKLYNHFVKQGVEKTSNILSNPEALKSYMEGAKAEVRNEKELSQLLAGYESKTLDNEFFKKLSGILNISDIQEVLRDSDDVKPLKNIRYTELSSELEKLYASQAQVDVESLKEALKDTVLVGKMSSHNPAELLYTKAELAKLKEAGKLGSTISVQEIENIVAQLKDNKSIDNVKEVLAANGLTEKQIGEIMPSVKADASKFFETVKTYNSEVLPELRGKVKAYLDLLNPIAGSKYESAFTKEYTDTMSSLMKELGVDYRTLKAADGSLVEDCVPMLSKLFAQKATGVEYGSDAYKNLIKSLTKGSVPEELTDLAKELAKDETLNLVSSENGIKSLNKAIVGSKETTGSFGDVISKFIKTKELDLAASKVKPAICLNYEIRKAAGEFTKKGFSADEVKLMDILVYNGNSAFRENAGYAHNAKRFEDMVNTVFDANMFKAESETIPGFSTLLKKIKEYGNKDINPTLNDKYFATGSMSSLFKYTATKLYNNKSWLKKFGTMAIILSAATLLIQPFFGNIKKEYPEQGQKG